MVNMIYHQCSSQQVFGQLLIPAVHLYQRICCADNTFLLQCLRSAKTSVGFYIRKGQKSRTPEFILLQK